MPTESKQQILERRREIEQEIAEALKAAGSDFTLDHVRDVIYHEKERDDMTKVIMMFDTGAGVPEIEVALELATDAWNYFPHKVLGGISPAEKSLEYQNNKN
jgi:hypothetical protein